MNKFHAQFDYVIDDNILIITDLNYGGKSVTNDVENVIHSINLDLQRESGVNISHYKILYQDSDGGFDSIVVNERGEFVDFHLLNVKNIKEAKIKIKND